jgi:hypothetical protein
MKDLAMASEPTKERQTQNSTKTKQSGNGWVNEQGKAISPSEFHELIQNSKGITINGKFYPRLEKKP